MADFMTPEEIKAEAQALKEAYDAGIISAQQFKQGMNDAEKGVRGYTAALHASIDQLKTDFKKLGGNIIDGTTGMAQYNSAVTSGGDAVSKMAMQFGPLGVAVGLLIKVITFGISEINKMSDSLYKANQDLSKFGAGGGMQETFDNMQKFGYGIGELGNMTELLRNNAQNLATFGGSVEIGTRAFANVAKGIKESDLQGQFMNMGLTVDDMNAGVAAYIRQQTMLGTAQGKSTQELTAGSADYLKNMNLLSRLTGQSAEQLQAKQEEAMAIESFYASLEGLSENEKKNQLAKFSFFEAQDHKMGVAFAKMTTGIGLSSEEASSYFTATGGVMSKVATDASIDLKTSAGMVAGALKETEPLRKGMAMASQEAGNYGAQQRYLANYQKGELGKAIDEQTAAQAAAAAGADGLTATHTKTVQAQMQARDSMQSLLEKGIGPVQKGFEALANVINKILHPFGGGPAQQPSDNNLTGPGITGKTADVLSTIRTRESGGNYEAQAKGSSASGAYQFIDSTWQGLTKKYGMGQEFKSAKLAPKEIQDQIAQKYVEEIMAANGGDVRAVANTWYTGNAQGKMSAQALAANNGLTSQKYTEKFMGTFEKTAGKGGYQETGVASAQSKMPDQAPKTAEAGAPAGAENDYSKRQLAALERANELQAKSLAVQEKQLKVSAS